MAHRARIRTDVTAWSSGAVLPSEFDKLDDANLSCLDGDRGGVWAPASAITIGGAGMVLTGLLWIQGSAGLLSYAPAQFQNTVTILSTLDVELGLLSAHQGAHIFGDVLTVDTAGIFNSTLDVYGSAFTAHAGTTSTLYGNTQIGLNASKSLDIEATLTANGPATFSSTVDMGGTLTVHSGATANLWGNVQLGLSPAQALDIEATTTFNGPATFNNAFDAFGTVIIHTSGSLSVNGPTALNGSVSLGDSTSDTCDVPAVMTIHKALQYTFQGRVPLRTITGVNSSLSYAVTDGNFIYVPDGTLSAARTYTLSESGAQDGDEFTIYTDDRGHALTVATATGGVVLQAETEAGGDQVRFVRVGGLWREIRPQFLLD